MGSRSDIEHWRINATVYEDRIEEEHCITDPTKNIRRKPLKKIWRSGELLGSGGCGEVRLQKSEEGKVRALKHIAPSTYLSIGGWEKELMALLEFTKPKFKEAGAFVELYGWFKNSYGIFLAMEYVLLGDLEKNVMAHSGKIPENEARNIITQILRGLDIMHRESFIHRDLKPRNILVVTGPAAWRVKIADFGLSKRLTETTTYNTRSGTIQYMAPELLDYFGSSSKYTYAIDLWAVGCIAYRLLTGKVPFPRNELQTYCRDESPFPSQNLLDNDVKTSGCAFIRRLLDKHSDQRPSASQALNDTWITSSTTVEESLEHLSLSDHGIPGISKVTESEGYNTTTHLGLKNSQRPSFSNTGSSIKYSPQECSVPYTNLSSHPNQSMINDGNDIRVQDSLNSQTTIKAIPYRGLAYMTPTKNMVTSLYSAALKGNVEIVKILLDNGVNPNVIYNSRLIPLDVAAYKGHVEIVKILLDNGADLNMVNKDGWTPLVVAADEGHAEIVKILLDNGANPNVIYNRRWIPLDVAAYKGHVEIVKILLDNGADLNMVNKDGWTPLDGAAGRGHVEIVKILLNNGADLNMASKNGWTPLITAASRGQVEVVKALLDSGADINVADINGWTPLNSAADKYHSTVVKALLDSGADINLANKNGWTPLNNAALQGHAMVVKILLQHGAIDVNMANKSGWTPLNIAAFQGHAMVGKILLQHGAIDVNMANKNDWTPLASAASDGNVKVVQLLLDSGADINMANKSGRTPLVKAIENGHGEVANVLLDYQASLRG